MADWVIKTAHFQLFHISIIIKFKTSSQCLEFGFSRIRMNKTNKSVDFTMISWRGGDKRASGCVGLVRYSLNCMSSTQRWTHILVTSVRCSNCMRSKIVENRLRCMQHAHSRPTQLVRAICSSIMDDTVATTGYSFGILCSILIKVILFQFYKVKQIYGL
jgi:hypothetical protein